MSREESLARLRDLSTEKPTTKMGQVRWAWPEIKGALAAGHTLQLVHKCLNEVGIGIGYRTLSTYVGRLEREQERGHVNEAPARTQPGKVEPGGIASLQTAADPFDNIRRERERKERAGFEYDAFSINKNLLR